MSKRMPKFLALVLIAVLLIGASLPNGVTKAKQKETLVVSTFGFNLDLIEKNVTKPFEDMYDVDVVYETGNNSERLAKLEALGDQSQVDVVHFAGAYAVRAKELDLLQPIDVEQLDNYDDLYEWAQDPLGDNMGIGYAINSFLLMYRSDKIEEPITSWADLLRDDVKGYVSVPDIGTTFGPATIVMLATALGGDIDNTEPAWDALPDLADQLVTTYSVSSELVTLVQEGEVWLAPYASFAIGNLLDTEQPLERVIPEEGIVGDPIIVSITKSSKKAELAQKYIDFLISNEVQTAEAMDLVDSPTNKTVEVPEDVAQLLTYGDDMIDSLIFLDQQYLNEQLDSWLERWNEIMLQ